MLDLTMQLQHLGK